MNNLHQLIPLAVGMLISPLPIVAIVAIVLAPRGRSAAPVYTATFTAVTFVLVSVGALSSSSAASASGTAGDSLVSLVLAVLLAIGFAVFAVVSWVTRPKNGAPAVAPKWLAAIDTITPAGAASLGFAMAVANSKNVPLALKGGALIGEARLPILGAVGLCLALSIAASALLIIPALVELGGSPRVTRALQHLKSEMIAHNAAMMTVLFAVLAANEAAQALHRLVA